MADDKQKEPEKKAASGIWQLYEVKGEELVRKNKFSPKSGKGYFMANHKDRATCGHSGYTEFESGEKKETEEAKPEAKEDAKAEEKKADSKEESSKEKPEAKAESKEDPKEEAKPEAKEEPSKEPAKTEEKKE